VSQNKHRVHYKVHAFTQNAQTPKKVENKMQNFFHVEQFLT